MLTAAVSRDRHSEATRAGWLTVLCADLPANEADTAKGLRRQVWQAQGECLSLLVSSAHSCNMALSPVRGRPGWVADGAVC